MRFLDILFGRLRTNRNITMPVTSLLFPFTGIFSEETSEIRIFVESNALVWSRLTTLTASAKFNLLGGKKKNISISNFFLECVLCVIMYFVIIVTDTGYFNEITFFPDRFVLKSMCYNYYINDLLDTKMYYYLL